jgi:beta-galactosidase/beta-glucuronidase
VNAQAGRFTQDLSMNNWKLWLDTAAAWQSDTLFVPPVEIRKLPVNLPTGGWANLEKAPGKIVHLPATVEEYYWGKNGNAFGLSGNYLGVSWFSSSFTVPLNQQGKILRLQFEAVRFRAEIFINKKLVGYDLVNSTPFEIDISDHIKYGTANEIAVRITDPNGNFDWRDSQNFMWGNYRTNPTHGFGGITGKVRLVSTDKVFTSDVFIKNKPKANEIDAEITTNNLTGKEVDGVLSMQVKEKNSNRIVYQKTYKVMNAPVGNSTRTFTIPLNDAKLWSVDSPHLYILNTQWTGSDKSTDNFSRRFGFRWFEIRDVAGDKQFYLNGKRIVLLTAI